MKFLNLVFVFACSLFWAACTTDSKETVEQNEPNEFLLQEPVKAVKLRIRDYTTASYQLTSRVNKSRVAHYTDYDTIVVPGDSLLFDFDPKSFRYPNGGQSQEKWVSVDVTFEQSVFTVHFSDSIKAPYIAFY